MSLKRLANVATGFTMWAFLDAMTGKPYSPEMALLAGFVMAWVADKDGSGGL